MSRIFSLAQFDILSFLNAVTVRSIIILKIKLLFNIIIYYYLKNKNIWHLLRTEWYVCTYTCVCHSVICPEKYAAKNLHKNINYGRKHRYESSRDALFRASYLGTLFRWWAPLLRLGGCTIVDIDGYQIEASAHRAVCTLDHDLHGKIHHCQTTAFPAVCGSLPSQRFLLHERAHFLPSGKLALLYPSNTPHNFHAHCKFSKETRYVYNTHLTLILQRCTV